jgi:hypothetical protein
MNAINTKRWNQVRNAVAVAILTTTAFAVNANEPASVALMGEMTVTAPMSAVPLMGAMEVSASPIRAIEVVDLGEMTVTARRATSVAERTGGGDDEPRARSPRAVLVQ